MNQLIRHIGSRDFKRFESLTFPRYRYLLDPEKVDDRLIALGYSFLMNPGGLALAYVSPEHKSVSLLSLFVKKSFRNQGIGTALLEQVEQEARQRECDKIYGEFVVGKPSTPVVERMLESHDWQPPKPGSIYCRLVGKDVENLMKAPWMNQLKVPEPFSIFPWKDVTEQEKQKLKDQHAEKQLWEPGLDPFIIEKTTEPMNSLGLRYRDEIVGWMITRRVEPAILCYDCLFVKKEFRKTARGIAMLAESIRRQWNHEGHLPYRGGVWRSNLDNPSMIRFVKRRLGPYLTSMTETRSSEKHFSDMHLKKSG